MSRPKSGKYLNNNNNNTNTMDFDAFTSSPRHSMRQSTKSLQCINKLKVSSTSFPIPNMSKITSLIPLQHPRYYEDTYLIAAKTNHIVIVDCSSSSASTNNTTNTRQASNSISTNNTTNNIERRGSTASSSHISISRRGSVDAPSVVSNTHTDTYSDNYKSNNNTDKAVKVQLMHSLNINTIMVSASNT